MYSSSRRFWGSSLPRASSLKNFDCLASVDLRKSTRWHFRCPLSVVRCEMWRRAHVKLLSSSGVIALENITPVNLANDPMRRSPTLPKVLPNTRAQQVVQVSFEKAVSRGEHGGSSPGRKSHSNRLFRLPRQSHGGQYSNENVGWAFQV